MALTDPPLPEPPVVDPEPFWTIMEQAPPGEPPEPSDPPPPFSTVQSQSGDSSDLQGGLSDLQDDSSDLPGDPPGSGVRAAGGIISESATPAAESSDGGTTVGSAPTESFVDGDLIDFRPLVAYASGFGPAPTPGSSSNDPPDIVELRGSLGTLGGLHAPAGQDESDYLPPWIGMDGATGLSDAGGLPAWLGLDETPAPLDLGLLQANGVPVEWDFSLQGRFTDWSLL